MTSPERPQQQLEAAADQGRSDPNAVAGSHPAGTASFEESLGEQLIREAREGQTDFFAGWCKFMQELDVRGQPIGAKKLRELLVQEGIDPASNEFSQGIINMREE